MIRFTTPRLSSRFAGQEPLRLRRLVFSAVLFAGVIGLGMQAAQGDRGWQDLQAERVVKEKQLTDLQIQNSELEVRIHRLGTDSLDLDYLDERARIVLGLTAADEKIIFNRHLTQN